MHHFFPSQSQLQTNTCLSAEKSLKDVQCIIIIILLKNATFVKETCLLSSNLFQPWKLWMFFYSLINLNFERPWNSWRKKDARPYWQSGPRKLYTGGVNAWWSDTKKNVIVMLAQPKIRICIMIDSQNRPKLMSESSLTLNVLSFATVTIWKKNDDESWQLESQLL